LLLFVEAANLYGKEILNKQMLADVVFRIQFSALFVENPLGENKFLWMAAIVCGVL
jgi:hypothetical protein